MAQHKIADITKKIETHNARGTRKLVNGVDGFKRRFNGPPLQTLPRLQDDNEEREDFKSALHQASKYIRTLHKLASPGSMSPPNSPSSSSTPDVPTDTELDRLRTAAMSQLIGILQRSLRVRYEMNIPDVLQAIVPALSDRSSKHCRATAYRLTRHMLVDAQSVEGLKGQALDWYIVKSLARDNKHMIEKEQVIKLLRAIVEIGSQRSTPGTAIGSGKVPLSETVMRAFIAVAEHPEDPFKPICVQTLTEILLIDIDLVARTGGLRVLLHALAEGPLEMAPILSSAFLYIADSPRTRAYLHPGIDLEMALSGVTDAYGKGPEHADRMRGITKVVVSMLRNWSGLMYFCLHDKVALRALVDGLRIPSLQTRELILDMFFDLFNIKPPEWHQAFIDGRRLTMYGKTQSEYDAKAAESPPKQDALKLTDQYIALLILVFSSAGLMDALTCMLEEATVEEGPSGSNLARKATLLLAEILQLANRWNLAADYNQGENRIVGTSTLSAIDSYNRNRTRLQTNTVKDAPRPRANSVEDAMRRGQIKVEQAKLKLGMQMDDRTFQLMLLDSQVMTGKDQTKWHFDVLQDLLEGPLMNPKRMEEAIKVSRYIRKLMSFFHPFSHRFSDLAKSKPNIRWIRLGCLLISSLVASPEGLRFLAEDDFLNQIVKSFAQLDPSNSQQIQEPIFSKRRMQETLTYGYFEMLGTLSKRKEGLELLEKFKLFTAFYHLSELKREDLVKAMVENLDYSIDGHSRIVLSKTLSSSSREIRLYATNHVGELVRGSPQANAWSLRLLLTQLYDSDMIVQEVAVRYLEEACEAPDVLQMVVEMHPTLEHLGDVGHPLLMKFMSTAMGFRYLYAAEYIDREMDIWFHERNAHYVVHIEVFLAKAFGYIPSDDQDDPPVFDGLVPPHFYGIPSWKPVTDQDSGENRLEPPKNEEETEVMTAIYNLANTVIANTASRSLARMKSRPEYRRIFTSTAMLYRALHVISSQRYRLPVRRYIIDLFNIELDDEVVKKLYEHAKSMRLKSLSNGTKTRASRALSIVGRPARNRRISDSDEESVSDDENVPEVKKHPVLKVRPMSRIVGFE
ncbi:hypothetical protein EW026_g2711 [Hermanssonia centrifuga]|uniref:Uncharacterized protein n=1 Tax=Hermanssonia centrifuga TaxID=98765 RepID=A0A4S4KNE8_9APHY|nr:hypothetical protein EW026_g2711 [Hermanssonia centrifuga]